MTPFCSCSSILLFIAFTMGGIPIGITMAFLITSPLINEVAVVLLWGLIGPSLTLSYVFLGLLFGVLGGLFFDAIKAERYLDPFLLTLLNKDKEKEVNPLFPAPCQCASKKKKATKTWFDRHQIALGETISIFKSVILWILFGVALGGVLHTWVPETWLKSVFEHNAFLSPPLATLLGIPLYTNVTGIIPIMEALLSKGLPVGTVMAFIMSAVGTSIPATILLKKVMSTKLIALFLLTLFTLITLSGWLLNAASALLF